MFKIWFNTVNSNRDEASFLEIKLWNRAKVVKLKAQLKLGYASQKSSQWDDTGDSINTSRPGSRWVYTFFMILRDGKLGGWVALD